MTALLALLLFACTADEPSTDGSAADADADADADTDTDTDADADTDTDTDTGTSESAATASTAATATTGHTGATGTVDTGPTLQVGQAYRFDPSTLTITQPPGLGGLIAASITQTFLVETIAVGPSDVTMRFGLTSTGAGQDLCLPTTDVVFDTATLPVVSAGPETRSLVLLDDVSTVIEEATLSLTFSPTYDRIVQGTLEGLLDTVPLVDELAPGGGDDAVCLLIFSISGVGCTTCPVSGSTNCLPFRSIDARALLDPTLSVVERTNADIAADPACN